MADERTTGDRSSATSPSAARTRARDGRRRTSSSANARSASSRCASDSTCCSIPARGSSTALLADHMDAGLGDRYLAADGAVTGVGEIDGRPVAVAAYDFTVMAGSMGAVGERQDRPHARARGAPAHAVRLAARLRRRAHPVHAADRRSPGAGALFREQVAMSGVVPMVAAMLGHCAAGTAYIPGARRLRADGEGHVVDGARRPAPREGRGGGGRHRGGDGRLGRPHQDLGRRRSRGRRRRRVPAHRARVPVVLPAAQRRAPPVAQRRPIRSTGASRSSTTSSRPRRGVRTTCARSSPRSSTTVTCSG